MKYLFSYKIVILYSLFIIVLSVYPFQQTPEAPISFLDKIIHFFMYFFLSFITAKTLYFKNKKRAFCYGFFYAFLLGILLEITQYFIPYRSFELGDILSNLLGSAAGAIISTTIGVKYA